MLGRTPSRLLAAALALAAGGCTSESPPTSSGDAIAPTTLGLPGLSDGCTDATAHETPGGPRAFVLPISVQGTNRELVLRPPGYCGVAGIVYCGHLVATATKNGTEVAKATSATSAIELPVDALEELNIRIELHNDREVVSSASPLDVVWSNNRLCLPGSSGGGGMGGGGGASSSSSGGGMGGGASDAGADGG